MAGRFYAALSYEAGRAFFDGGAKAPFHSGSLSLVGETPVGVLVLGGALGDKGERKIFFRLGRSF